MLALSRVQLSGLALLLAAACASESDAPPQDDAVVAQAAPLTRSGSASTGAATAGTSAEPAPANPWEWSYFRALRRLHRHWRAGRAGGEDSDAGTPAPAHCGDAKLEGNEQCDDGNNAAGDGCDARCDLEDRASTPGDDRPGYVLCATSDDPALTCSPEQRCCRSPENTCDSLERDCQRPEVTVGWGDNCDGPEDCETGLTCVRGKYGASCTPANPQQGYPVLCHAATDCAFIPEARCGNDGTCTKL